MSTIVEAAAVDTSLLQPRRPSTSCEKHHEEQFTGFCPTCLCERLSELVPNSNTPPPNPPSITTSTAAAALRAIFKPSKTNAAPSNFPELRRTKSFSASKNEGFSTVLEPQRKSCDVRVRSTLYCLFTQDDEQRHLATSSHGKMEHAEIEPPRVSASRISTSSIPPPVLEEEEEGIVEVEEDDDEGIVEVEEEPLDVSINVPRVDELKPMKEHIDLDVQVKKRDFKEIAGSFWSAASVFSKKLQKWRQKQKMKKQRRDMASLGCKPAGKIFGETQSEVADYGYGRRSCDIEPRFSLDIGRMSFEDQPRYSFDEPRASWDGFLNGGRLSSSFVKMPSMAEHIPASTIANNINGIVNQTSGNIVTRSDAHIPVEFENVVPGGTVQTREYYLDTSSRRRRSLDRSNSSRKPAAAVVAEMDDYNNVASSKIPSIYTDENLRDSFDCAVAMELKCGENGRISGNGVRKMGSKKAWRWGRRWKIWGLIQKRSMSKEDADDRRNSLMERSFSESWSNGSYNSKVLRSSSSVSWRSSLGGSARKTGVEINGVSKREYAPERTRSTRYSPTHLDNGLLRFYLTPMSASRRVGLGRNKPNHPHSIARSALRLY